MDRLKIILAVILLFLSQCTANYGPDIHVLGPQAVNLWKLESLSTSKPSNFYVQDSDSNNALLDDDLDAGTFKGFKGYWFRQPLDHFDNSSQRTFRQRYWINTRHYRGDGGPVIVLDGGETSGEDRIPFLDTGIVEILARNLGAVGVVLEHRYYGRSIPVTNLSTDALRWLTNEQSAADSANFMANVKFDGIEEDLTAPNTPWIYYGGSYAGARAAHMRVLYPDLVFGAIASSAVTHASILNWEYMEIIRRAADPTCSSHLENSIKTIDAILDDGRFTRVLKGLFGLADLEHDEDFVSLLESPLGSWQSKNWDPEVGSTKFDDFCEALGKAPWGHLDDLPYGHAQRTISLPGGLNLDFSVLNYAKYIKENVASKCPEGMSTEECFGTFDSEKFQEITMDQTWRLWTFQVCTQWGYFSTAPPDPEHPRIISKLLTLAYESRICLQAFPDGKFFSVPALPNITAVNALGDFDIAMDRLAIIDGEVDPWRPNTPHSEHASDREDTMLRPFKLIPNGVHHYDEFGLRDIADEPPEIRKIHGEMILFVTEWLMDWTPPLKEEERKN